LIERHLCQKTGTADHVQAAQEDIFERGVVG
jgi:hypothetical protein